MPDLILLFYTGHQAPMESNFIKALPDHLNAEIVNGTINNIKEAIAWLGYTFLYIRMLCNPLVYGMDYEELYLDPSLTKKRKQLINEAAIVLDQCMMIRYDQKSGNLAVTDVGRIASHYYIHHRTIESFQSMCTAHLNDAEALHVLCCATEFDQLKVRPEEVSELDELKNRTAIDIRASSDDTAGKVNVLLQSFTTRSRINSFTLQSDCFYVAQNASRLARALFEMCLKRSWSSMAAHYLELCKALDKRLHVNQTPLRQFEDELPQPVLHKIETLQLTIPRILDMGSLEVGLLVHQQKLGGTIAKLAKYLPSLQVHASIQPITRGVIRIQLTLECDFVWSERYHGFSEPFWIWIEDSHNEYIYHTEYISISYKKRHEVGSVV